MLNSFKEYTITCYCCAKTIEYMSFTEGFVPVGWSVVNVYGHLDRYKCSK